MTIDTAAIEVSLTDDQVRHWNEQGFLTLPKIFDDQELELLRKHCAQVLEGVYELGRPPLTDPFLWRRDPKATQLIDNPHWADSVVAAAAMNQLIGGLAAKLLGTQTVRLWATQFLHKPPGGLENGIVGWHQDYDYWECVTPPRLLTAWIPLDDVSAENGTLSLIPGSHLAGHLRIRSFLDPNLHEQRQLIQASIGEVAAQCLTMQAGQVSLHHCLTLHASGPNLSEKPRRALTVHMMAGETVYRSQTACDAHPNVFLLGASSGSPFVGRHFPTIAQVT